ncbi:hypothetical protein [Nostoc sp.]|uniref:hypothetical protein n=1 Tax=Nostoc sp. TaxID=1180 RepID=UPI002FEFAA3F
MSSSKLKVSCSELGVSYSKAQVSSSELEVWSFKLEVSSSKLKGGSFESDRISFCFHESSIDKLVWRDAIA